MSTGMISSIAILICVGLAVFWSRQIGWIRGLFAGLLRLGWILPVIWTLTPETVTESLPNVMVQQPVHILLDDSASMRVGRFNSALNSDVQESIKDIEETCQRFGCLPKIERLSEMRSETKKGFTPLSAALEPWLFKIGSEPWMVLSDGADWRPGRNWDERLRGRGQGSESRHQGLIVSFGQPDVPGFWLEDARVPSFAFEGRSTQVDAGVARASNKGVETVQIQVVINGKAVTSANAVFADGSYEARAVLTFASPPRGAHLVTVKSLPVSGEKDVWDNEISTSLEVLPNTLGVLHLLGSPSWDGRFLRRYLKSEPKFDLISFFILRDPWDSQQVSERDLSLIPFPVERLFKEELASFRVLVIQNFNMQQFLQPEFQRNLTKFVLDGGGLLFIGGPRALTEGDLLNSPMAELLPFTLSEVGGTNPALSSFPGDKQVGSTYDGETKFSLAMANPDPQKRALANVYEEWDRMSGRLNQQKGLRGLHRMSAFRFKQDTVTPLLDATLENGSKVPVAVASYPGKGRALWIFSDSLWRMALSEDEDRSRFDYNRFIDGAMTWLMRNDRRPALITRDFKVERIDDQQMISWRASVVGPAARYVGAKGSEWSVIVCGQSLSADQVKTEFRSAEEWVLSGSMPRAGVGANTCAIQIVGQSPAFGSVTSNALAMFSETLSDKEMSPSPRKLKQLSELTGGLFVASDGERSRIVLDWLRTWTGSERQALPNRFKTIRDFYWAHKRPWIWLVILMIPLEVLVRRWHLLVGYSKTPEIELE